MVHPDEAGEWEEVVVPGDALGLGEGLTVGFAFALAVNSRSIPDGTGVSAIAKMCASVM